MSAATWVGLTRVPRGPTNIPTEETEAHKDPGPGRESCHHSQGRVVSPPLNRLRDSGGDLARVSLTPVSVLCVLASLATST